MTLWLITPQDTVLFRDGRPFSANPGARARSLPFPFPTTTAGAARTRAGQDQMGKFEIERVEDVLRIAVRGPLLASVENGHLVQLLPPAPSDALAFAGNDGNLIIHALSPLRMPAGALTDLENVPQGAGLALVGLPVSELRKPAKEAPAFWNWSFYADWLLYPSTQLRPAVDIGVRHLETDRRMHVGIDAETMAGRDGDLFMTGGLSFRQGPSADRNALSSLQEFALVISVESPDDLLVPAPGIGHLGGERRLAHWQSIQGDFPSPPPGLKEKVKASKRCRIILLTPMALEDGWWPHYLCESRDGVNVEIKAAAVGKPQTISGWDLSKKGPRLSRRLVPAGSVFYLELTGEPNDIDSWFDKTWFHCMSDEADDRASGFGLVAIGTYEGPVDLKVDETSASMEANDA